MKQHQINMACAALSRLGNMQLRLRDSRNIYMLSKELESACNFEIQQERKLIEKYNGRIEPDGHIVFKDADDENGFIKEFNELRNLDVEVDFNPVTVNCDGMDDLLISPYDIACLDGFVTFV